MTVNFNNLRKQACYAYDRLTNKLNSSIDNSGQISISAEEIQEDMDDLRMMIMSIACVFEENNADFSDVSDQVGEIGRFNSEDEE